MYLYTEDTVSALVVQKLQLEQTNKQSDKQTDGQTDPTDTITYPDRPRSRPLKMVTFGEKLLPLN